MRKIMIIISACLFATIVSFFTGSIINAKEKEYIENIKDVISAHLDNAEYSIAFNVYNNESEDNQALLFDIFESYADKLCESAYDSLTLEYIVRFKESGGDYKTVLDTINQIETEQAALEESNDNYFNGVIAYNNRDFDEAQLMFEKVIDVDINYEITQEYLIEIEQRTVSWNENAAGVNSFYNAECFDGEYLYIPFVLDGIDGIYKINSNLKAVDFFPLSDEAGTLVIEDINAVGDYLYFIAGENVGSGYTFDSPYSIYEMKTDGSDLCVALEGNFTDLYIKGDSVYALSREIGLIEYDRNFDTVNTICPENVVEFSVSDTGIYYVVQGDLTHDSDNSLYVYDGTEAVLLNTKEHLHYYGFEDNYAAHWQYNSSYESMYYYTENDQVNIKNADIYKFYGMVDDKLMYSCVGSLGREIIYAYDSDRGINEQLVEYDEIIEYSITGVFYEQDILIAEQDNQLYFSDSTLNDMQALNTEDVSTSKEELEANAEIIMHLSYEDIYLDEGEDAFVSVIEDKQIWHYKDDELNITVEKRYVDEYDCNVYVTHIFTTDYSLFSTENGNSESAVSTLTYKASTISDAYSMIYAQNTDTFLYSGNSEEGIIIRQGEVVRDVFNEDMIVYFDDGSMEAYRYGDEVDADILSQLGANTSFSFGPILLEDYEVDLSCVTARLADRNPRSAIGYVEEGHYVFVACDGRDSDVSRGLCLVQLAEIFKDEGCELAYNLDGGMTTTVLFMGNYINYRPSYESGSDWFYYRSVAEMMYFGTSEMYEKDLSAYTYHYDYYTENYK